MSILSEPITEILLEPCIETYIRYLGAFKVVESDYGLFDKLARPRDFNDFVRVVYESIRVQERVLMKLEDGISKKEYELAEAIKNVEINKFFRIGKDCLVRIMELAKENPRLVGSIISSLALAYDGVREIKEKGKKKEGE
ncbi:MAG: hypothetical protein QXF72_00030 [Nitrososphaerota archaeon]